MPTTRAAQAAAAAAARRLIALPTDALGLILYRLTLAHDIAAVAPTCHALSDAAKLALKLRPFSGKVVTLAGHTNWAWSVAVVPDARIFIGSGDGTIKLWRDGACVRTIQAHTEPVRAVAVLPGGERFFTASLDRTAKLWTLDGLLERTIDVGSMVICAVMLPDGVHFVVSLGPDQTETDIMKLYHVDGTLRGPRPFPAGTPSRRAHQHGVLAGSDARRPAHDQ